MAERRIYFVSTHGNGGWKVEAGGARRATHVRKTKGQAVLKGKELARSLALTNSLPTSKTIPCRRSRSTGSFSDFAPLLDARTDIGYVRVRAPEGPRMIGKPEFLGDPVF